MIDLHCHLLPGIDDGSADMAQSIEMARVFADQGVTHVACTPHILPGVYHNSGPDIIARVRDLQRHINEAGITLTLLSGADNHVVGDFVKGLKRGHLLPLGDSRYVLVEPPHHVAPQRLEEFFFSLMIEGYFPILTHPERLTWIEDRYDLMRTLVLRGVWMQLTAGSIYGAFGRRPRYWAERMLDEGLVHIIATDAHNLTSRRPDLARGHEAAAARIGQTEADHMVVTRPSCVLSLYKPSDVPAAQGALGTVERSGGTDEPSESLGHTGDSGLLGRLRRVFD